MEKKRCSKCGEEKPLSEFNKDRNSKDGLSTQCSACKRCTIYAYRARQRVLDNHSIAHVTNIEQLGKDLLKVYNEVRNGTMPLPKARVLYRLAFLAKETIMENNEHNYIDVVPNIELEESNDRPTE